MKTTEAAKIIKAYADQRDAKIEADAKRRGHTVYTIEWYQRYQGSLTSEAIEDIADDIIEGGIDNCNMSDRSKIIRIAKKIEAESN